jgi:hypothetical protein
VLHRHDSDCRAKGEAKIVTYVASPKTKEGTAERATDCYQCVSSTLRIHDPTGALRDFDHDLIAAAIEAGWGEDEIRAALNGIRSGDPVANTNIEGHELGREPGQMPSSDPTSGGTLKGSESDGREAAQGLQESAEREERRIERQKGSPLAKGEERFEERSRSSDGRSAGEKQNLGE